MRCRTQAVCHSAPPERAALSRRRRERPRVRLHLPLFTDDARRSSAARRRHIACWRSIIRFRHGSAARLCASRHMPPPPAVRGRRERAGYFRRFAFTARICLLAAMFCARQARCYAFCGAAAPCRCYAGAMLMRKLFFRQPLIDAISRDARYFAAAICLLPQPVLMPVARWKV